jgi:hypothetical protein
MLHTFYCEGEALSLRPFGLAEMPCSAKAAAGLPHSKAPFGRAFCKNHAALGETPALLGVLVSLTSICTLIDWQIK